MKSGLAPAGALRARLLVAPLSRLLLTCWLALAFLAAAPALRAQSAPSGLTATAGSSQVALSWTAPPAGGSMNLQSVDNSGTVTNAANKYGPNEGWTAVRAAGCPAGSPVSGTYVLWTRADGTAALWLLDSTNVVQHTYLLGAMTSWTATDLTVTMDGNARVLWTTTDGQMKISSVDSTGAQTMGQTYATNSQWHARSIAATSGDTSDNTTRVLWTADDGTVGLWFMTSGNALTNGISIGPISSWTAVDLAVSGKTARILWSAADGTMAAWSLTSSTADTVYSPGYGPYPGWHARRVAGGASAVARILWVADDGELGLWLLDASNVVTSTSALYSPAGWPAPVDVAVGSDDNARVLWSANIPPDHYNVKRATTAGGQYTLIGTAPATATTYTDSTAVNGTTYFYVVSAAYPSPLSEGGNSGPVSATPQPIPGTPQPPPAPGGFTAVASSGQVVLSWTASPTATTYKLKRFNPGATAFTTVTLNGVTTYTDTTVSNGTTYFYVVTASNSSGESPCSVEEAATPYGPTTGGSSGTAPPQNYPYVQYQTVQMASVSNLRLAYIFLPKSAQIQWDYTRPGFAFHYAWTRTANPSTTPSTDGSGAVWNEALVDSFNFSYGTPYIYSLQVVPDGGIVCTTQVINGNTTYIGTTYTSSPGATITMTPFQALATDDQAVDSRYDMRYGNPTPLDHNFGTTAFRGGLFTGYSTDPARAGRSFLKFSVPPPGLGQNLWTGTINSYFTGSLTSSSGTGWPVGCQTVSPNWSAARVVWSTAPGQEPAGAATATYLLYDTANPATYWANWVLVPDIVTAMATSHPVSVELMDTAEAANQQNGVASWTYFAKKEYDSADAPSVVYAMGAPLMPVSVTTDSPLLRSSGTYTGTVFLNGPAPAGGATVTLSASSGVVSVPASVTIPAGSLSATFPFTTTTVGTTTYVYVTATYNLPVVGTLIVTP